jgi:hypothetical protein
MAGVAVKTAALGLSLSVLKLITRAVKETATVKTTALTPVMVE